MGMIFLQIQVFHQCQSNRGDPESWQDPEVLEPERFMGSISSIDFRDKISSGYLLLLVEEDVRILDLEQ